MFDKVKVTGHAQSRVLARCGISTTKNDWLAVPKGTIVVDHLSKLLTHQKIYVLPNGNIWCVDHSNKSNQKNLITIMTEGPSVEQYRAIAKSSN